MRGAILERLRKNVIAIVVVQHHEVVVAVAGGDNEAARLISEDLSSGFQEGNIAVMCLFFRWGRKIIAVHHCCVGLRSFDECRLGGSLVLSCLVEVSFVHGAGDRRVSA